MNRVSSAVAVAILLCLAGVMPAAQTADTGPATQASAPSAKMAEIGPAADAEVASHSVANINYGKREALIAMGGDEANREVHIRFEVKDLPQPFRRVLLRMYCGEIQIGDPQIPVDIYRTSNDWDELKITWNSRPKPEEKVARFAGISIVGQYSYADLTNVIRDNGTYSFLLKVNERSQNVYGSRENIEEKRPVLMVEYGEGDLAPIDMNSGRPNVETETTIQPAGAASVSGDAQAPETFLAFDVRQMNRDVNSAKLRVYCEKPAAGKLLLFTTNNSWKADSLTWDKRPAVMPGQPLAEAQLPQAAGWVEFDLGDSITGSGRYSYVLRADSAEAGMIASAPGEHSPQMVLRHQPGLNRTITFVRQQAAGIRSRYEDRDALVDGILDVTKGPYCADPTGKEDSTLALQRAINEGRNTQLVIYLPKGTYLISETLEGLSPSYQRGAFPLEMAQGRSSFGCIIKGSGIKANRPVIKLADHAKGFDDPQHPKPMLHLWAIHGTPPNVYEKANINYAHQILDINFDTNGLNGNAGAIGFDFNGCETTSAQSIHVNADGSFAGFQDGLGSGGGMHDISVTGGQYGAYVTKSQPTLSLSHVTFKGQKTACILNSSEGPLVLVGAVLEPAAGASAIVSKGMSPGIGGLSVIDAKIVMAEGEQSVPAIRSNRSFYLNNVYLKNAAVLSERSDMKGQRRQSGVAQGWCHVKELAEIGYTQYAEQQAFKGETVRVDARFIDGTLSHDPLSDMTTDGVEESMIPADLQSRHHWGEDLPYWGDEGVLNARDLGVSGEATPENFVDQAPALQKAIDEASAKNAPLFLPRGYYPVSKSIVLRSNTVLIGTSHLFTRLIPLVDEQRHPDGSFLNSADPQPLIVSPDDPAATTRIAFMMLAVAMPSFEDPEKYKGQDTSSYAFLWQSGRNSLIRNITFTRDKSVGGGSLANCPLTRFKGNGGGRWYNACVATATGMKVDYEQCRIEGTSQPLAIYHFQPQLGNREAICKRGFSMENVRNVDIYGIKFEGNKTIGVIRNCDNIRIFGEGGNGHPNTYFDFIDCRNFLVTSMHPNVGKLEMGLQNFVSENGKGTGDVHQMIMYRSGNPSWVP